MKIKLSRIVLILSIVGVLIIGISIKSLFKENIEIEDVYGSRNVLGNMNIVLQKSAGLFENDNIKIDKNGEKIDKYTKTANEFFNLTKENIENRELFKYKYNGNEFVLKDKNNMVMCSLEFESDDNSNKDEMKISINIKDEKNKIENYYIDLNKSLNNSNRYVCASLPVKKEGDNIYIAVMYSYFKQKNGGGSYDEDYTYEEIKSEQCESTNLSLYKINLSNKSVKNIISNDYNGSDFSVKRKGFVKDDRAYFVINKKQDKSDKYTTNLFEFNTKTKEINFIDLKTDNDYVTFSCDIQDEEILLISSPIQNEEEVSNKNTKFILVDLKNRNIKYEYNLNDMYNGLPRTDDKVRRDNGKIYIVSREIYDRMKYDEEYKTPYNFYVIDESNGKKLYEGNVKINPNYFVKMGIVLDEEI